MIWFHCNQQENIIIVRKAPTQMFSNPRQHLNVEESIIRKELFTCSQPPLNIDFQKLFRVLINFL